jgi:hypothetical protein
MVVLRFLSLAVLAIWIGGLAVLGTMAAPVIFAVLESHAPATGAPLAGELFGALFRRFQLVALGLGGLLMALLGLRAALGPRPRRLALRLWTVAAMLAMSLATTFWIAPRIDAIRSGVPGAVAALPPDDPRRAEFGTLHAASTGFMFATLLAGLGLLFAETHDVH